MLTPRTRHSTGTIMRLGPMRHVPRRPATPRARGKAWPAAAALAGACLLAGCASTAIDSQWADPELSKRSLAGAKVLVTCQAADLSVRLVCGDQMAAQVKALGGVPLLQPNTVDGGMAPVVSPERDLADARAAGAAALFSTQIAPDTVAVSSGPVVQHRPGRLQWRRSRQRRWGWPGRGRADRWRLGQHRLQRQRRHHRRGQRPPDVERQGQRTALVGCESATGCAGQDLARIGPQCGAVPALTPAGTAPGAALASRTKPALFVVFNLGSGAGDAGVVRTTVEGACAAAGRELHLLIVDDPKRLGALAADAVQRAQACGGVVVAAGGDGTINAVAQAALGSGCAFGVLPQGTFNYFSRTHGIPADTAQALQVLLHEHAAAGAGRAGQRPGVPGQRQPRPVPAAAGGPRRPGSSSSAAAGWWPSAPALATLLRGTAACACASSCSGEVREVRTPTLFVGNNALQLEQLGLPRRSAIEHGAAGRRSCCSRWARWPCWAAAARRARPAGRGRPGAELRASRG